MLLNKSPGIVIGCGTRSTPENRSLSLAADMFEMDPDAINGFKSDPRSTLTNSVALAIPVLTDDILSDLRECFKTDKLPVSEDKTRSEDKTAEYLKHIIEKGDFLLSSSDMDLNDWFNR